MAIHTLHATRQILQSIVQLASWGRAATAPLRPKIFPIVQTGQDHLKEASKKARITTDQSYCALLLQTTEAHVVEGGLSKCHFVLHRQQADEAKPKGLRRQRSHCECRWQILVKCGGDGEMTSIYMWCSEASYRMAHSTEQPVIGSEFCTLGRSLARSSCTRQSSIPISLSRVLSSSRADPVSPALYACRNMAFITRTCPPSLNMILPGKGYVVDPTMRVKEYHFQGWVLARQHQRSEHQVHNPYKSPSNFETSAIPRHPPQLDRDSKC